MHKNSLSNQNKFYKMFFFFLYKNINLFKNLIFATDYVKSIFFYAKLFLFIFLNQIKVYVIVSIYEFLMNFNVIHIFWFKNKLCFFEQ